MLHTPKEIQKLYNYKVIKNTIEHNFTSTEKPHLTNLKDNTHEEQTLKDVELQQRNRVKK